EVERYGPVGVVGHDPPPQITSLLAAAVGTDERSEIGGRTGADPEYALEGSKDVFRLQGRSVGVADASPKGERVRCPVVGRSGDRRREIGNERRPGRSAGPSVRQQAVVRVREEGVRGGVID